MQRPYIPLSVFGTTCGISKTGNFLSGKSMARAGQPPVKPCPRLGLRGSRREALLARQERYHFGHSAASNARSRAKLHSATGSLYDRHHAQVREAALAPHRPFH